MNPRQAAKVAGIGYIIIFILAIFANFFVFEALYVPSDAVATTANIVQNEGIFRLGIMSFIIVTFTDILIAWALYYFFMKRNEPVSRIAMLFRVANAILFAAAISFLYRALQTSSQNLATQTLLNMESFHVIWMIALFGFGIHLLFISHLVYEKNWLKKTLAILIALAGVGYMVDTSLLLLLPNYLDFDNFLLTAVATLGIIGELGFTIWIIVQGFGKKTTSLK